MKMILSPFTIEHYDQVIALWKQCAGIGLSEADSKESIAFFLLRNPGFSVIATMKDQIVGALLAGHDGRRGYLHHLAVSPQFRRMSIGTALVDKSLENLARIGISKCHLYLFNTNDEGRQFWESTGWEYRHDLQLFSKML